MPAIGIAPSAFPARHRRLRFAPLGEGDELPSENSALAALDSIDPDFDVVEIDGLLRDLAVVPPSSTEDDVC